MYSYDNYGWLVSVEIGGRQTDKVPPKETKTKKANWNGEDWVLVTYVAPTVDTSSIRKIEIQKLLQEIDAKSDSPRARREALLGNNAWLTSLDAQATSLRSELATL